MTTVLICSDYYSDELSYYREKYPNITIVESKCSDLLESQPVIFRVPEGRFYHHVTKDRFVDVLSGHADDLLIQTGRLFSVEMKRYVSEPKFRSYVKGIVDILSDLKEFTSSNIEKTLASYAKDKGIVLDDIVHPIKVALVQTTKGPELKYIMEALGKKIVLKKVKNYLHNYKYRI